MFQPTIWQTNNPETLPITLSEPEIVTETELPERLQTINSSITTLENKTQNITYETEGDKTIIGNLKVTYDIDTYTLSVGSHADFSGSVFFSGTINGYNIENELSKLQYLSTMDDVTEVSGPFRARNLVGITYDDNLNTTFFSGNLSSPNISSMNNNLSGIIYNSDDGTGNPLTEFTHSITIDGNITADNIGTITTNLTGITYDYEESATRINHSLIVSNDIITGNLNGFSIGPMGIVAAASTAPFLVATDVDGVTEIGKILDFHNTTGVGEDYLTRLACISSGVLELMGTSSMRMSRIDITAGMSLRTGYTLMKFYKNDTSTSMLTLDADTNAATFLGNIVTPSLNGNKIGPPTTFLYSAYSPFIPVCDVNGVTELSRYLDFHNIIDSEDYKVRLACSANSTLRIFGPTADSGTLETNAFHLRTSVDAVRVRMVTNGYQNICVYNTAGTFTWVMDSDGTNGLERWSTTRLNAINASTRTTAITYTAGTPSNTTIAGDLTVTGVINGTLSGSQTITHKTKYIGAITPGCFIESTGLIYQEPTKEGITSIWNEPTEEGQTGYYTTTQESSSLSPYENCISFVKMTTEYNNNIIGVCTEIIDNEFLKYATHGDVLIKVVSATYTIGDIFIPTTGGYAKKANNMEIIDAMTHMIIFYLYLNQRKRTST